MNKKHFLCIPFMAFLLITHQSFSMHRVIFTASRIASASILPFCAAKIFYNRPVSETVSIEPVTERIQKWGTDILEKLDVPGSSDIVWIGGDQWATSENNSKQEIKVPMATLSFEGFKLDYALDQKRIQGLSFSEWAKENIAGRSDSEPDLSFSDQDNDKVIARNSMALKHEAAHIINEDSKNGRKLSIIFPLIVQAAASTSTYCFNRLLNINPPKTVLRAMGRSLLAVGGIIPKLFFTAQGLELYFQYTEKRADEYACKNAETRLELTEFADDLKKEHSEFVYRLNDSIKNDESAIRKAYRTLDPYHPYLLDRVGMVEKYIQKWDEEHKNESNNE